MKAWTPQLGIRGSCRRMTGGCPRFTVIRGPERKGQSIRAYNVSYCNKEPSWFQWLHTIVDFLPQVSCLVGSCPPSGDSHSRLVNLLPPLFPGAQNYLLPPGKWEETGWRRFTILKNWPQKKTSINLPSVHILLERTSHMATPDARRAENLFPGWVASSQSRLCRVYGL